MAGIIEEKLSRLGYLLRPPKAPVANYLSTKQVGNILYVSGRVSELKGIVGEDLNIEQAKQAACDTLILLLSIVKMDVKDLDIISGVIKLQGFIRSSSGFTRQPEVLDGASDLLIELFGENGKHARTATGVNQLPFGACLQIDMILSLK